MKIAIVCKTFKKWCGIGQYSINLAKALNAELVQSATELSSDDYSAIIINVDYNFYPNEDDFRAELRTSKEKSKEVIFDLHTVLRGTTLNLYPQRKFVKSPFGLKRTTNAVYVPHFIYPANSTGKSPPTEFCIGTFGFASPVRRMKEILEWGDKNKVDVKVIATINTSGVTTESSTKKYANEISESYPGKVDVGYFTHDEIVQKLEDCSHLIFMRNGDPTIGVSGAVHLAYNSKRPIIVEHKALCPELNDVYVSRLENLTKEKLKTMTKLPTGGITVDEIAKKIIEILNNNKNENIVNTDEGENYYET